MGETSRLTAPVSQLKCYSRGNFSADTFAFAESSWFGAIGPIRHIHTESTRWLFITNVDDAAR